MVLQSGSAMNRGPLKPDLPDDQAGQRSRRWQLPDGSLMFVYAIQGCTDRLSSAQTSLLVRLDGDGELFVSLCHAPVHRS